VSMVHIYDVFDAEEYQAALDAGHIKVQKHPEYMLFVANYSDKAVYDRAWNSATLACRGLIFDMNGYVVARPFKKFFNQGEGEETGGTLPDLGAFGPMKVYEKQDGSLGIFHQLPDGSWAVATRGSFQSEQAVWATAWLRRNMPDFAPEPGTTQLVEIIYPQNRIVVDYHGWEGLVSLAVIDNTTGRTLWDKSPGWTGEVVEQHALTLDDVLTGEDRPNHEGYVLHFPHHDVRVKIKHGEYVRLHHIVTGATELAVWRAITEGDGIGKMLDGAPDDLRAWVDGVVKKFEDTAATWSERREAEYSIAIMGLRDPKGADRREFAARATQHIEPGALFTLLDGKSIRGVALARLRPHGTGDRFSSAG